MDMKIGLTFVTLVIFTIIVSNRASNEDTDENLEDATNSVSLDNEETPEENIESNRALNEDTDENLEGAKSSVSLEDEENSDENIESNRASNEATDENAEDVKDEETTEENISDLYSSGFLDRKFEENVNQEKSESLEQDESEPGWVEEVRNNLRKMGRRVDEEVEGPTHGVSVEDKEKVKDGSDWYSAGFIDKKIERAMELDGSNPPEVIKPSKFRQTESGMYIALDEDQSDYKPEQVEKDTDVDDSESGEDISPDDFLESSIPP